MDADPGDSPSDEELMRRLRAGDDAALAPLMHRWETPVKRFAFRFVGNPTEAEDLAQETFARVYLKRTTHREGARFSPWLFSIAANLAKNRLRWCKRRPACSFDAWLEAGGDAPDGSAAGAPARDAALRREQIAAVQAAVLALPPGLRAPLVLFEYENLTMDEIATALGCTPKAVEGRLARARQQLKQALSSP